MPRRNRSSGFAISLALLLLPAIFQAGCSTGADPYAESQMDLKPAPATVSDTRHTGAFLAGEALSIAPSVGKLGKEVIKTIQIDVIDRVIEIAPGVSFSAWTFGGHVPGPIVHARVGDRIRFSMTNRSDEAMPGIIGFGMPMMHSMDFHAAMVSPQDKYRSIAPGQTISFEFQPQLSRRLHVPLRDPDDPGAHRLGDVRHAHRRTSQWLPDQGGSGIRRHPERVLRRASTRRSAWWTASRSTFSTPTGFAPRRRPTPSSTASTTRMVDHPLPAKPGERVRLYVLNVGPSNTSSFHVVGTIFDRVWIDGNPDNQFRGMQTVLLPSSGSAIVEFKIPESGKYVMVDHHFANASQGAIGVIDATGGTAEIESEPLEHHNIPATSSPTDPDALQGQALFDTRCLACHTIGKGPAIGPDSAGRDRAARRTLAHGLAPFSRDP